jgi:hypothetical protein
MRIAALAILIMATVGVLEPAQAQTYDPAYPVCLHVFRPWEYYECGYTSLEQCKQSASARAAMCEINPYYASGQRPSKPGRRPRPVY